MDLSSKAKWNSVIVDKGGHDLHFSLTIKNFLDYVVEPGESCRTPQLECTQRCGVKWNLELFPHGVSEDKKDDIAVYLTLFDKPLEIKIDKVSYEIYILGRDEEKLTPALCDEPESSVRTGYGTHCMVKRSEIESNKDLYLRNGHLTVQCIGKAFPNKPNVKLEFEYFPNLKSKQSRTEVLRKMYEERINCDVVLKTGSNEYKCHKAVLSGSSSYFMGMFNHEMKENLENVVDLSKDLKNEELKALLDYIYIGTVEFPTLPVSSFQALYSAADMYDIEGFKDMCEVSLIAKLNVDNAMDILNFAVENGAIRLRKESAKIIFNSSG